MLERFLELGFRDRAALDEQRAEPLAVGGDVLPIERLGERLGRHQPAAHQDVAERLPDRARRRVHEAPEPHHHQPVRVATAEHHLPGAVVERQEVQKLGELDLLESTGQAHGPSGSAGPSSIGAPG